MVVISKTVRMYELLQKAIIKHDYHGWAIFSNDLKSEVMLYLEPTDKKFQVAFCNEEIKDKFYFDKEFMENATFEGTWKFYIDTKTGDPILTKENDYVFFIMAPRVQLDEGK